MSYKIPLDFNKPPAPVFHSKEKLSSMLENGPELIPIVQDYIEKNKLPYIVKESDGNMTIDGQPTIKGYGYLFDTLSPGELHLNKFITEEPSTIKMKDQCRKIAKTPYEVLVIGETGTGKEIIAKSMIADRKGSIKAVNCAGFPETLIEAELFGYVKGAFTGADSARDGLMTAASDGVMFMDEIGELPLVMQAKLLRAIQEKRIRKVGGNKDEDINCKFVFATNRNLKEMVDRNEFRKDLYARISTLEVFIKSLKPERECDVVPIIRSLQGGDKFLERYADTVVSMDLSMNVRSLQQYVIRYMVLGSL